MVRLFVHHSVLHNHWIDSFAGDGVPLSCVTRQQVWMVHLLVDRATLHNPWMDSMLTLAFSACCRQLCPCEKSMRQSKYAPDIPLEQLMLLWHETHLIL